MGETVPRATRRSVSEAAEAIVRDGLRVRSAIADLTIRTYRVRGMAIDGLAALVEEVLLGVVAGLSGIPRPRRDELLRQVFEGLADAYAFAAEHSRRVQRWEEIEASVTRAVSGFAARAGDEIMREYKTVTDQVRDAGQRLRPRAQAAMNAIDENVVEPASQAAAHGARRVKRTLGVLLAAAGELLRDLGDTINDQKQSSKAKRPAARPAKPAPSTPSTPTKQGAAKGSAATRSKPVRPPAKQGVSSRGATGGPRSVRAASKKKARRS